MLLGFIGSSGFHVAVPLPLLLNQVCTGGMAVHFCCCLSLLHNPERTSEKMEGCAGALMHVRMRVHACMCMFVCVSACLCLYVCVCVCLYACVCYINVYLWLAVPPSTNLIRYYYFCSLCEDNSLSLILH